MRITKYIYLTFVLSILSLIFVHADEVEDVLWDEPTPINKEIKDYSLPDVVACYSLKQSDLEKGHPFLRVNIDEILRLNWPGAKDSENVDALLLYLQNLECEENVEFAIRVLYQVIYIMDIAEADIAQSLQAIHDKQNSNEKKWRFVQLTIKLWAYTLDSTMFRVLVGHMDDDFVLDTIKPEGATPLVVTVSSKVSNHLINYFNAYQVGELMNAGEKNMLLSPAWDIEDNKLLKNWISNHFNELDAHFAKKDEDKDRVYIKP